MSIMQPASKCNHFLIIEPFYGGSHRQLIDTVFNEIALKTIYSLPAKKWHWKARVSALSLSQIIEKVATISTTTTSCTSTRVSTTCSKDCACIREIDASNKNSFESTYVPTSSDSNDVMDESNSKYSMGSNHLPHRNHIIFSSSVLNLSELISLRPDLAACKKILYFHENQLQYPVRQHQERDFQYGYNQIISSLVADVVLFNSKYNMDSFLSCIPKFLKMIPDGRPEADVIVETIQLKSQVLYYAMCYPDKLTTVDLRETEPLHVVWPHRWEHDKDPELFFSVMELLHSEGLDFKLSVLGEQYDEIPEVFRSAQQSLKDHIVHWGFATSKQEYYKVLRQCHVVVSTAKHEFFGVAMLEAVHLGCYPLAPNALVYPEHFPDDCLYNTPAQLAKKLRYFCRYPHKTRGSKIDVERYSWNSMKEQYYSILGVNVNHDVICQ